MNSAQRLQHPICEPYCIVCNGPFTGEPWNEGVCYVCQNFMNLPDEQRKAIIQSLETQAKDPTPYPADSPQAALEGKR